MKYLYVPVYTVTLLLSAFLLFAVQPMFGKMILPMLGGSPSVWNTAMLFFQLLLLAGYGYAHGIARFMGLKTQAVLHTVLLIAFATVLPIAVPDGWLPPEGKDPTFWQLALMTVAVGGPFFIISASAPLLQHWFAHTGHKDAHNPYFLYAASNLGSITALLAYPFFIEPALRISEQSLHWAWGYGALIALIVISALLTRGHETHTEHVRQGAAAETITWQRRGMWLLLAFIPSSLMLGVTSFITTDLASVPLLWIMPLALYVSTFIIAFARKPLIGAEKTYYLQGLTVVLLFSMIGSMATLIQGPPMIVAHLLLFFLTALMCHHELAALRPHAGHLTQFYLIMSTGGALGGFFNAIIAPNVFNAPIEYAIVLALGCFMREITDPKKSLAASWTRFKDTLKKRKEGFLFKTGIVPVGLVIAASGGALFSHYIEFSGLRLIALIVIISVMTIVLEKRWIFGLCALSILVLHPPGHISGLVTYDKVLAQSRNFFGVIRVADVEKDGVRMLLHGTTVHGNQPISARYKLRRLSYYSENSGVADAFNMTANEQGPQNVGAIGLGIGVIACFPKDGRRFDFFEIDADVAEVAENPDLFTYLRDCGSPYEIILGDGRLKMQDKPDNHYDIIVIDAFSSDSIPVHLLTAESFALYRQKLKPGGYIIINISNRYMNLRPVVASAAQTLDMLAYHKRSDEGYIEKMRFYGAEFMVVTDRQNHADYLLARGWIRIKPNPDFRLWTDQYSNIVSLFKLFMPPDPSIPLIP